MGAFPQRLRPKHQILILKCYPRMQKSTVEIRPNSSELSYLLYYVSTRRTKLQKVGAFLEKKTASDVYNLRLGNVQVTLQIVTAVIDKCPHDVPLYVSSVLHILDTILRTNDINLIEASLPAFTALCTHYDSATLSADQDLTRRYDAIIRTYAAFASRFTPVKSNGSVPEAIRFRSLGLQAIKSMVSSDCFAADSGKHLRVFMPFILENLYSESPTYLGMLRRREATNEQHEKEHIQAQRHRPSLSITRSTAIVSTDFMDVDPAIAAGTAADVDKRADEEVGVLAMQSLRQIFTPNNRNQVRVATNAMLGFTMARLLPSRQRSDIKAYSRTRQTWSTEIFDMVCRWTPVQDRYVILVTAMESLIRSPILEDDLPNQLELTRVIASLLRSNINFIGLSVMDVLIGLIQHILLLLQLGGQGSALAPHHQQSLGIPSEKEVYTSAPQASGASVTMEVVPNPSAPRIELLAQLQHCVGDLATHVYYSDQIGDMVAALLLRLKPSPTSSIPTAAAAVENPTGAVEAIAESIIMQEKPRTDGFFSFDTARLLALKAVTEILFVANSRRKDHTGAVGRNRVEVPTWEGTQWLLRDPDGRVRKAYVEALLTWLKHEVDRKHLDLVEDQVTTRAKKRDADANGSQIARRAISNASQRSRTQSKARSFFLQLLHLAVYENALHYADSEPDILLLHLLLVTLVQRLGVNAVRTGLPMIFRLQEDINSISSPSGRIAVSSLVHGYFWALSETFEFDNSILGRDIHGEISRRAANGLWLRSIRIPPLPLENIGSPVDASSYTPPNISTAVEKRLPVLYPFDARHAVVDVIAEGYERPIHSPPSSPLPSPARTMSYTAVISSASSIISHHGRHLPGYVRDEMLSHWTKEECISSFTTHDSAKAASFSTSRGSPRTYLSPYGNSSNVNMPAFNNPSGNNVDEPAALRNNSIGHSSTHSILYGALPPTSASKYFGPPLGDAQAAVHRRLSRQSSRTPLSVSSASHSIARVADLKRALEGTQGPAALPLTGFAVPQVYGVGVVLEGDHTAAHDAGPGAAGEDSASDSMVSIPASFEDGSVISGYNYAPGDTGTGIGVASSSAPPANTLLAPPTTGGEAGIARNSSVRSRRTAGGGGSAVSGRGSALGQHPAPPKDVMDLLKGIDEGDIGSRRTVVSVLGAPPY